MMFSSIIVRKCTRAGPYPKTPQDLGIRSTTLRENTSEPVFWTQISETPKVPKPPIVHVHVDIPSLGACFTVAIYSSLCRNRASELILGRELRIPELYDRGLVQPRVSHRNARMFHIEL